MAIDLTTRATFTPEPGSFLIGLSSDQYPEPWEIPLGPVAHVPPQARLAAALVTRAAPPSGGRVEVTSSVPVGAGVSSSAAFSVALLLALGQPLDATNLAKVNQAAEGDVGSHVGLLDPLAIVDAQAGHALFIDFGTADLERHQVAIPPEAAFIVVHSEATRELNTSAYATRRAECERAAHEVGRPLGQCELGDLSVLADPILRRRARHVITECARVRLVEALLERGNLVGVGAAMSEGHRSLAEDYRVSIAEVDDLVASLQGMPGVLGARMSGGGFGGCVIALCEDGSPALDPDAHAPRRAWRVSPAGGAVVSGSSV
jgi:galactokinase